MKSIMLQRALALSIIAGCVAPMVANPADVTPVVVAPAVSEIVAPEVTQKLELPADVKPGIMEAPKAVEAGKDVVQAEGFKAKAVAALNKSFATAKTFTVNTYNTSVTYAKANPKTASAIGLASVVGLGLTSYGLYRLVKYLRSENPVQGCQNEGEARFSAAVEGTPEDAHKLMCELANKNDKKTAVKAANTQPTVVVVAKRSVTIEGYNTANVNQAEALVEHVIKPQVGTLSANDEKALKTFKANFSADAQAAIAQLGKEMNLTITAPVA